MPVSIALSFPGGRFHATPWGHHVNEALPEWPPSPWRLLRALIAVWKRKLPNLVVEPVIRELAKLPPSFHLPPATLGHTRHYMPLDSTDESKRTKVFDAFVSLAPSSEVLVHWPDAELDATGREMLSKLLSQLGYFGRAESWSAARLLENDPEHFNSSPGSKPGEDSVRVLTADPESWDGWHFTDKKIVPPDPKWNLLAETADLHLERWSDPPGSKWVTYSRPSYCFAPRPRPRPASPGDDKTKYTVARFVLDVAEGRRPLPLVTETIAVAEEMRRQLGREYARVVRARNKGISIENGDPRLFSPVIHGKDENGEPSQSHDHAFYLPTDEYGDGRIDHVTIFASGAFSRDDVSALDRLRWLSIGKEGEGEEADSVPSRRRPTHRLLLIGLDAEKPGKGSLFRSSPTWVSSTPYVAFRHFKPRGSKRDPREFLLPESLSSFLVQVFKEDWNQRSDLKHLPVPEVEFIADPLNALGWKYRSIQFRRGRNRRGDTGWSRAFGALRLSFPEPICGPVQLGYSSHFGMGGFRADG